MSVHFHSRIRPRQYSWSFHVRHTSTTRCAEQPDAVLACPSLTRWVEILVCRTHRGRMSKMVGVRGFEPPASWSQTMRASRCATPRIGEYTMLVRPSQSRLRSGARSVDPSRREASDGPFQPPGPQSWGIQQMKRGFAPLHAPMGGIGKAKLAREAWTTPDPGQGQVPALDTLRVHPHGSYMT
jgi:hypothetical protein